MGCAQGVEMAPPPFHEKYVLTQRLGTGTYASVYAAVKEDVEINLATSLADDAADTQDVAVAVKVIELTARRPSRASLEVVKLDEGIVQAATQEERILRRVSGHPNVIRFVEAMQGRSLAYIVMERCCCSMLQGLERMPVLSECTLAPVFQQMLQGIAAVHAAGVAHRDIKPDNFLFAEDGTLKLCDFGLSEVCGMNGLKGEFGTLPYMAPEMLTGATYDLKVDVWSVAAIFYVLLYGKFPYRARSTKAMEASIRSGSPALDFWPASALQVRSGVSRESGSFMEMLMQRSPSKRPAAREALNHGFLTSSSPRTRSDLSLKPMLELAKQGGAFGAPSKAKAVAGMDLQLTTLQERCHGRTAWCRDVQEAQSKVVSQTCRSSITSTTSTASSEGSDLSSELDSICTHTSAK